MDQFSASSNEHDQNLWSVVPRRW